MPFKQTYKETYLFLTRGVVEKKTFRPFKLFTELLAVYSLMMSIVILYIFTLVILFFIFKWNLPLNLTKENIEKKGVLFTILISVIIGPIVEELGHRAWLVYSKRNFSLLVFFFSYFVISDLTLSGYYAFKTITLYKILFSFLLAIISYKYLRNNLLLNEYLKSFWTNNTLRIIYISIFTFSFHHITNFPLSLKNLILMPLITMPQTIYGVFLGFIRLKYGLKYSILLHSAINSAALIPIIFRTLL